MKLPKLILTDIDGVWTDGGMYYDQFDNELKKFNTSDSAGLIFLRKLNIPLAIVSGEDTKIVQRRAKKLKIEYVFLGVINKLEIAKKLCLELKINLDETAFIGDDLLDINLLKNVGFSSAPANAPEYIKDLVDYVTIKKGGEGAFREFIEYIISSSNIDILKLIED